MSDLASMLKRASGILLALLLSGCTVMGLADTAVQVENATEYDLVASVARCDEPASERLIGPVPSGRDTTVTIQPGCTDVIATFKNATTGESFRWSKEVPGKEGTTYIVRWQ